MITDKQADEAIGVMCGALSGALVPTASGAEARTEWYEGREELFAFAEAVHAAQCLEAGDLFYLLRKPWKWTEEHAAWVAAGRPDVAPEVER